MKELLDLLRNAKSFEEIDEAKNEIARLMPKVSVMFDYDQQNYAHPYDLWEHCVRTVLNLPKDIPDDMVYLAALLHDIGKPDCQCTKENDTNMHYYGHPARSAEIVRDEIIPDWESRGILLSDDDKRRLVYYVEWHDDRVSLKLKHVRQHICKLGVGIEEFRILMLLQVADAKAHVRIPIVEERIRICTLLAGEEGTKMYERILAGE